MNELMTIEEMKEKLSLEMDEMWFINYFEINIDDLIEAFGDRVEEKEEDIPYDLGWIPELEDYEDRESE
jgi:hypothetical protein